ncbi:MAG: TetR/AcrR family transcriptional regulator, partial [Actinobacteria bacterium]|nr:TetR/AcrR family transcriptional regulator [Actinomycetota bacterium]
WLPADDAQRAAEWGARIVLSYTSCPADDVDLADEASARRLVQTFVLPGLVTTPSK